jgi:hypothetical protein
MLIDLVDRLIADPVERRRFMHDREASFERHAVSESERALVLSGDPVALTKALGEERFYKYQKAVTIVIVHPFYPGINTLVIDTLTVTATPAGSLTYTLTLGLTWQETAAPQFGLPSWFQVLVFNDATGALVNQDTRGDTFVVPNLVDIDNKNVVLNRVVTFPAAGSYSVVADASGSKEVLPSAPAHFTIPSS